MLRSFIAACALFIIALSLATSATAQDSSAEARNIFSDAANLQNAGKFGLAIEQYKKFLGSYAKDPLADKAHYYLAVCLLQEKNYAAAADSFATVVKDYPKFANREEAYLNLGWSQYQVARSSNQNPQPLFQKSADTFAAMVKEFPSGKGKLTDQALWYLAESIYNKGDANASVEPYMALVKNHKESSLRADALYALGVTYEELGDYGNASVIYDTYLDEFAKAPLATEVGMRKGETIFQSAIELEKNGMAAEAKPLFEAARDRFAASAAVEGFSLRSNALTRQASCETKLQNFGAAADLYASVATEFPKSADAPEAAVAAARAYYRADNLAKSAEWFANVYKAAGKHTAEAAHWLCRIDLKNGKPQPAADRAAAAIPGAAESQYLVNLKLDEADALDLIEGKREAALAKYAAIAAAHPDHTLAAQALYNAAYTAMKIEKFDQGIQHASTLIEKYPTDSLLPDAKYVLAECQLLAGKHVEAEKNYTDLVANYADRPDAELWRVRQALAMYLQGKYQEVADALTPHIAAMKKPDNVAESQSLIGLSQFQLEKYDAAITAFNAALAADPKWRQADQSLLMLSRAYRAKNDLPKAQATVDKMIADFGKSSLLPEAIYRSGEYAYAAGNYDAAAAQYAKVIATAPKSSFAPFAKYGAGWSQFLEKKYEPAIASFTSVIADHADNDLVPKAHYARGLSRRQTSDFNGAIEDIDLFLKSAPEGDELPNALYEKGMALVGLKKRAEAIAVLEQLLKDTPKYNLADQALYELGWAYKEEGKEDQAVATFARLVAEQPESSHAAEAYFHVGEKAYGEEKFADSAKSYEMAVAKSKPGDLNEKAIYKLGWSKYQQDQYEESLASFTKQTSQYPKGALYADAVFMKAESLFKLKKYEEAMPVFDIALVEIVQNEEKGDPTTKVVTLLHGGQTAAQLPKKDWQKSLDYLSQIPAKFPESNLLSEANFEIGMAQHGLGKTDEALAAFDKATADRGAVGARARFMRGEIYYGQKKYDLAEKEFLLCMFGFGGDNASDKVKNWQAKCGFEAGRIHDERIASSEGAEKAKHIKTALENYQYVVTKHPKDPLAADSAKRVAELKKL